jgi:RsiW-degrading membrane proteinase PrsW (M82 family)
VYDDGVQAKSIARTEIVLVAGLLVFCGAGWVAEQVLRLEGPVTLGPLVSLALAAVPAVLWLGYFYLQDRREPEPKHFVAGVYLLGAFVANPLAAFLIGLLPTAIPPGSQLGTWQIVHAVLVVGLAQELGKYLAVRYSIYLSAEFDEPMDGIVYMTAAGIGFATAENARYLAGLDGHVFLATGVMNVVITTLAHACFAGVLGAFMGRARFAPGSAFGRNLFLLGGLLAAAALNGAFSLLEASVKVSGMSVQPWRGVAFAAAFAVGAFAITFWLMRRQSGGEPTPPATEAVQS